MGSITDLSNLLSKVSGGSSGAPERPWVFVDSRVGSAAATTPVASRWSSLWLYNRSYNGVSANPGAVNVPTRTSNGALTVANASGGLEKKLLGIEGVCTVQCTLLLYDRLLHISGLSGTSTSAQNVQSGSGVVLTRNTGGVGNQIWVEIYTAIGTTATTITASYTNQAGTAGRTTVATAFGGSALNNAQRMINLPLQAGDTGVQSVQTVTLAASTLTAGDFGVTIVRPLLTAFCPVAGGVLNRDLLAGIPPVQTIDTDACIAAMYLPTGATAPQLFFGLGLVDA